MESSRERYESIDSEFRELQRQNPRLQIELEDVKRRNRNLEEKLSDREKDSDSFSAKLDQLTQENEKFRNECLAANLKIQEHLGSVRVAEANSEYCQKSLEKEKEKTDKLRHELDEIRHERNNLQRDKDERETKSRVAAEKLEKAESDVRSLELQLAKSNQNLETVRNDRENTQRNFERDITVVKLDSDTYRNRYEESLKDVAKLRDEIQAAHANEIRLNKTIAQLEAQVTSESEQKGNLSLREQSWLDEKSELRDEIQNMRRENQQNKINFDDFERRNRDTIEDLKIAKMNLENKLASKNDDIGMVDLLYLYQ